MPNRPQGVKMTKIKNARYARHERRTQTPTRLIALGVAAIALLLLVVWWSTANSDLGASTTNAIGLQVSNNPSETDIAGLQSAEKAATGQPVLVWFHADW